MIIFTDRETQQVFTETFRREAASRYNHDIGTSFILMNVVNHWLLTVNDVGMYCFEVLCPSREVQEDGTSRYFDFAYWTVPADENGNPDMNRDNWRKVYNGGMINRGETENPKWSLHT